MTTPTAFILHPAASLHDTGWGHPEHQGRLRALASSVGRDMFALHGRAEQVMAEPADRSELVRVHSDAHVAALDRAVARAAAEGRPVEFGPETPVSAASLEAILGSLGAGIAAVDGVLSGRFRNAFVATRPPGHHCTAEVAMGFCPVNTIAVLARRVLDEGQAERVLIVDWDVHHGNGTQEIFWRDPDLFYLSLHEWPLFPGTGAADETGAGPGAGTTLNRPLRAGTDGATFAAELRAALRDALDRFTPDLVLVSCGFDGLATDPLGGFELEPSDYHAATRILMEAVERVCGGRIVALLEGGYDPRTTGFATVAVLRALAGVDVADPTLPAPTA
ncbi:MAG: histone deacetylase [Longimicrobiales bacterium]|nr:histone deacetylase [Longimicrobiales bacterium]